MAAVSKTTFAMLDYAGKIGTITVNATELSAANFAGQATLRAALLAAIVAVTNGVLSKTTVTASIVKSGDPKPTDPESWRSKDWLVSARDTNGNAVSFHISTAAPSVDYLSAGTNNMDLTSTEGAALVNAVEAYVKSNDGEAILVESITYVDK